MDKAGATPNCWGWRGKACCRLSQVGKQTGGRGLILSQGGFILISAKHHSRQFVPTSFGPRQGIKSLMQEPCSRRDGTCPTWQGGGGGGGGPKGAPVFATLAVIADRHSAYTRIPDRTNWYSSPAAVTRKQPKLSLGCQSLDGCGWPWVRTGPGIWSRSPRSRRGCPPGWSSGKS